MRSAPGERDLTARATIRNAALKLFAELGPDAVSVRQIAAAAGVSPALVLHHFGSKAGLRAAVDAHVVDRLGDLVDGEEASETAREIATGSPASIGEIFARYFPPDDPLPDYLRRQLLAADDAGTAMVRTWFEVSRQMFDQMVAAGLARESADPDVRAAFMLGADLALLLLRRPLTEALGFDPLSPDGVVRWAAEVTDITRYGVFPPEGVADPTDNPHREDE
jgi:AcrR family transcriptional regulator